MKKTKPSVGKLITTGEVEQLKKENFALVTEVLELTTALITIEGIAKKFKEKVRI